MFQRHIQPQSQSKSKLHQETSRCRQQAQLGLLFNPGNGLLYRQIIKLTHFQTMAFSDALYLAFPFKQINWTPDVFKGVGIFTSIFCPSNDGLKFDFKTTFTSILVRPTSRTNGITRKGKEISFVVRYLKIKIVLYMLQKKNSQQTKSLLSLAKTTLYTWYVTHSLLLATAITM